MADKAVVLLSGGMDSAVTLALAASQGFICVPLSFDYGQRHRAEIHAARQVACQFGMADLHRLVDMDLRGFSGSALTNRQLAIPAHLSLQTTEIPITYVPARNTLFLSYALGVAETLAARYIYIGVNAVDYSGYPDCRPEYIAAFQKMADLATRTAVEGEPIRIKTPLLHLDKSQIIRLGSDLGVDFSVTVSCYQADESGFACGACSACCLRRNGFRDAAVPDSTRYLPSS